MQCRQCRTGLSHYAAAVEDEAQLLACLSISDDISTALSGGLVGGAVV